MGVERPFVQDNHSLSGKGILRGLHYQLQHSQAKLLPRGARRGLGMSPSIFAGVRRPLANTSARFCQAKTNAKSMCRAGSRTAFLVLSDEAEFFYKCDDFYTPGDEYGLKWDDPALEIDWPLDAHDIEAPLLSDKDEIAPSAKRDSHRTSFFGGCVARCFMKCFCEPRA